MIKITRQSIIAFIVSFILVFLFTGLSHAQEENPEETAKKHGISFPISELGNCSSFSTCKSFCDSESNRETCINFAKKKGFYKGPPKNEAMLSQARSELGCDSEQSCRAVCEQEANREKCMSFAQKHGLGGPPQGSPGDRKILERAKSELRCDSESSCKSVCENPANQEKCSNFAKASGLGGGVRRVGPGGCNSEESCKVYCETHQEECGIPGSTRRGPGGCNSEESCRKLCEVNPEECKRQGGGPAPAGVEDKFCSENPEKCAEGRGGPRESGGQRPDRGAPEGFDRRGPNRGSDSEYREFRDRDFGAPPADFDRSEYPTPSYQSPPTDSSGSSGGGESGSEVRGINTSRGLLQTVLEWFVR